ncbi:MAG: hypothetical protein IJ814_08180 [Paludibacteraceae bacterium]|nr:hypothetical protein [Paludibacteraceae bacterium]
MNKKTFWVIVAILVIALAALAFLFFHQNKEMTELVEQMTIEKEELQEEYEDLAIQFDGYQTLDIKNDSLQDLLSREQQRVQDLLEELRITKVTNARRIAELKKELATVRTVMKDYVRQIDSLNATNARLTQENIRVTAENRQMREQNTQLEQANTALTETVTRAAMLKVTSCTLTLLNKRDHKTKIVSQAHKLQFDFTIAENITCTPGMKNLYVQVRDPQGGLLGYTAPAEAEEGAEAAEDNNTQTFEFENERIPYSLTQEFEYTGEEYHGTCYCPVDAEIVKGFYTVDFFCDGNLIGSYPIQIKK